MSHHISFIGQQHQSSSGAPSRSSSAHWISSHAGSGSTAAPGVFIRQLTESDLDRMLDGGDPNQDAGTLRAALSPAEIVHSAQSTRRGASAMCGGCRRPAFTFPRSTVTSCCIRNRRTSITATPVRDARRHGIDGLVRRAIFETLRSEGFTSVCSYVRRDNDAGLRAASRWQRPTGTIRYIAVRGRKPIVMRSSTIGLPKLEHVCCSF